MKGMAITAAVLLGGNVVLLLMLLGARLRRKATEPKPSRRALLHLTDRASRLIAALAVTSDELNDPTILSKNDQAAVAAWQSHYRKVFTCDD